MSEVTICHLSCCNPETVVYCHSGKPGTENGPYRSTKGNEYPCSMWDKDAYVCRWSIRNVIYPHDSDCCKCDQ